MIRKLTTSVMTLLLLILVVSSIRGQDQPPQARPEVKDCCKIFRPKDCPPVKPCQRDACVIIQIAPLDKQDATFTHNGTYSFMSIFGAGVARGVENATIRAMNAIKTCSKCNLEHAGECAPDQADPATPTLTP